MTNVSVKYNENPDYVRMMLSTQLRYRTKGLYANTSLLQHPFAPQADGEGGDEAPAGAPRGAAPQAHGERGGGGGAGRRGEEAAAEGAEEGEDGDQALLPHRREDALGCSSAR